MKLKKYNSENFVEKALILNFTKIDNLWSWEHATYLNETT